MKFKRFVILIFAIYFSCIDPTYSQKIPDKNETYRSGKSTYYPYLDWGTFFSGSDWVDWTDVYATASDNIGNSYYAGTTESNNNIATVGAHQTSIAGDDDGYIEKFDAQGQRVWGTYYGGALTDQIYDMTLDGEGNIIIVGITGSPEGISTPETYQPNINPFGDGFIVKLDQNGIRIWGTYLGGNGNDRIHAVNVDIDNTILVTGNTRSSSDFSTSDCHQPNYGGGTFGDSFIAKFTPDGQIVFCSYYGGVDTDEGNSIYSDSKNNIYMAGVTKSTNNIATEGAQQTNTAGYTDGFLTMFNSTGQRIWGTYLGGNGGDNINNICTDTVDNIYVVGQTGSVNNIATPGSHKDSLGYTDGFIVKYNSLGLRSWGTYFGGDHNDAVITIERSAEDNCIIIGGSTSSDEGISMTGSHQFNWCQGYSQQGDPLSDGFIVSFDFDGNQLWGTYLGGNRTDNIYDIAVDTLKNIYYAGIGTTLTSENLITPGCFQDEAYSMYSGFFGRLLLDTLTTSIPDVMEYPEIVLFPNPCSGNKCEIKTAEKFSSISIFNMVYQEIESFQFSRTTNYQLNLLDYKPGLYLIRVTFDNSQSTIKLFIN